MPSIFQTFFSEPKIKFRTVGKNVTGVEGEYPALLGWNLEYLSTYACLFLQSAVENPPRDDVKTQIDLEYYFVDLQKKNTSSNGLQRHYTLVVQTL